MGVSEYWKRNIAFEKKKREGYNRTELNQENPNDYEKPNSLLIRLMYCQDWIQLIIDQVFILCVCVWMVVVVVAG